MNERTARSVLIRVLGPVDVVVDGAVERLGSRMERKLLAALALSANHAVSVDQLSHLLWGDRPPPSRANTLQTYVARLRRSLGGDTIVSSDHGYELRVARSELDAVVFDGLAATAASMRMDPAACRSACRDALSLWRGVPFGAFADEDPFRLDAIRLDETRIFLVELMLESEVALGNEELVVGSLEALVAEYPCRERMWELLATALSLCGRRVEALRAIEDFRRALRDVGLEPTEGTRSLEREIFSQDDLVGSRLRFRLSAPASASEPTSTAGAAEEAEAGAW